MENKDDFETNYNDIMNDAMKSILRNSPDLMFVKDRNSLYLGASVGFANMVKLKNPDDIVGKTDYELFGNRGYASKYLEDDRKLFNRDKPIEDIIEKIPAEDGSERYCTTSKYLIHDKHGNIIGMYGISKEITKQVQRDKSTYFSQNDIATYDSSIHSGMWSMYFDENGNINNVQWSDNYRYLLGYTNEEDFPNTYDMWISSLHPEDRERIEAKFWKFLSPSNKKTEVDMTFRMQTAQGYYRWYKSDAKLTRRENGYPILLVGTFVDKTEENKLKQALDEEKHLYRDALTKNSSYYFNFDLTDGYIVEPFIYVKDFNPFSELNISLPIAFDDFTKLTTEKLGFEPIDSTALKKWSRSGLIEDFFDGITYVSNIFYCSKLDLYYRHDLLMSVDDVTGHIKCFIIATDISSSQKAEEETRKEIQKAYIETERANKVKTEFLSNMSHDIKTPINGIMGFLNIAEKSPDNMEIQEECRNKIKVSAEYLLSLIDDVLDMSTLESENSVFEEEPFSLNEQVENCIIFLDSKLDQKRLNLEVDCSKVEHDNLLGSAKRIKQVIMNLLSNAVKYTNKGGTVKLKIEELPKDNEISSFRITVKDNGIGISPEFLPYIFDCFSQGSKSARTSYEGSGLGLSIVKEILNKLDGYITVDSAPGRGSTFVAIIPIKINKEINVEDSKPDSSSTDIDGTNILLVDDNRINIDIAKFLLEDAGAKVDFAVNGLKAVEIYSKSEKNYYDCILMDIMMPVMNGLEATQAIRDLERPDAKTVPIFAMTANTFAEDIKMVKDAGMNEHLAKPLDVDKVFEVIHKYRKK